MTQKYFISCQFVFPKSQNLQQNLMCRYWIEKAPLCNFSEIEGNSRIQSRGNWDGVNALLKFLVNADRARSIYTGPCLGKRKRKINTSVHQAQTIGFDKKGSGLGKIYHLHPRKPHKKTELSVLLTVCLAAKKIFSSFFSVLKGHWEKAWQHQIFFLHYTIHPQTYSWCKSQMQQLSGIKRQIYAVHVQR